MLKKFLFTAAFLTLFSSFVFSQQRREMYPPLPPSSLANSWEITKEQNKLILTSFFPYGAVDRKITLIMGNTNGTPSSGFAIYPMDFRRDLKDKMVKLIISGNMQEQKKLLPNITINNL